MSGKGWDMSSFKRTVLTVIAFLLVLPVAAVAEEGCTGEAGFETCEGTPREIGDVLQYALPITALGSSMIIGDWEGAHQYAWALGSTMVTVGLAKGAYGKLRPNTGSETSFPSGHTAAAFSGASFIYARYENFWGWLAYGAAAYTGYSRVWADAHFLDDVVAGASTATLWSLFFTSPYSATQKVSVMPMQLNDGYGLVLNIKDKTPRLYAQGEPEPDGKINWFRPPSRAVRSVDPNNIFSFGFGPAFLSKQEIRGGEGGTTFDLYDFNRDSDPVSTAAVSWEFDLKGKHSMILSFWPFESRDQGKFTEPVNFGDEVFPADTNIRSAWLMYDLRGSWNYDIYDDKKWSVDLGLGITAQYLDIFLQTTEGPTISESITDTSVLPLAHLDVLYRFAPKWGIYGDLEGIWLDSDWIFDSILALQYDFNPQWGADFGWRHYARDIETSKLANATVYDAVYFAIRYSF